MYIDYPNIMSTSKDAQSKPSYEELTHTAQELRKISKLNNISIIIPAQNTHNKV